MSVQSSAKMETELIPGKPITLVQVFVRYGKTKTTMRYKPGSNRSFSFPNIDTILDNVKKQLDKVASEYEFKIVRARDDYYSFIGTAKKGIRP